MEENLELNPEENLAVDLTKMKKDKKILYFKKMIKILEENASKQDVPVEKVIKDFISDLQNNNKEGYERKVKNIGLRITKGTLGDCIKYMEREATRYKQKTKNDKKKKEKENKAEKKELILQQVEETINETVIEGKQGTKKDIVGRLITNINQGDSQYEFGKKERKFILKKLNEILDDINKEEQAEIDKKEEEKRNAEKAMEQIQDIVDREYKSGNIKNRAVYLSTIRDAITGKSEEIDLKIKLGEMAQEQLLHMIDDRIIFEKDELYFEQVRNFTSDFQFLRDYPEIVRARRGATKIAKFTDTESYERFCSLRGLLQKQYNENIGIENLLKRKNMNSTDLRILSARQEVIKEEFERRVKTGEIR